MRGILGAISSVDGHSDATLALLVQTSLVVDLIWLLELSILDIKVSILTISTTSESPWAAFNSSSVSLCLSLLLEED